MSAKRRRLLCIHDIIDLVVGKESPGFVLSRTRRCHLVGRAEEEEVSFYRVVLELGHELE